MALKKKKRAWENDPWFHPVQYFLVCRLSPPSVCLKQYTESAEHGFGIFHTHMKNASQEESGVWLHKMFPWQWSLFERFLLTSSSPHSLTACCSPYIAVSALFSLLIQLLVGLQVKNTPPKTSGAGFVLTKIIPGICFRGCSANSCVSTTEGVTNSSSEVEMRRDILEALLLRYTYKVRASVR